MTKEEDANLKQNLSADEEYLKVTFLRNMKKIQERADMGT